MCFQLYLNFQGHDKKGSKKITLESTNDFNANELCPWAHFKETLGHGAPTPDGVTLVDREAARGVLFVEEDAGWQFNRI